MRRCLLAGLLAAALILSSCAPGARTAPAAKVVARVLQLRESAEKDAKAYAPLFSDPAVASALASAAVAATSSAPPIPPHDAPYVSRVATSSADVVVVWHAGTARPDWPAATLFTLRLAKGAWVIADAQSLEASRVPPPASLR